MNKSIISGALLLITGGFGGHYIDDFEERLNLEVDRYPIRIEHSILDNCISNYKKPIKERIYMYKKEVCICALGATELEYSFDSYQENNNLFLDKFESNAEKCMKDLF